ncbi:tRNA preQ1(34) S-adenosylmethionine ribosyltransferase-isomerase QueA [Anabaena cylindrica FACHB-243]|uniref:S-adenosylmethionine:tRNA ribosyltransferase-isomerase n=1 Tax=Anabaena cylindrica (strain ATCC 27899 / PCC 7122) TaxID=272123 RepID=K9ZQH6_ANACC|nr:MULTISPECIES: tRNA preQ1(34) S-adenosylmethionine ribosyltransferase-isomerase QueA [Anabaena]AFZ60610.1 S-adenosylmethionine--tRNA ribosyltransferase-isomerase [Anabaena cylindrica PCC 7122]MBD2417030.1 tRNA preQ1(34) S-adenosylmethionine ribosyltransferase-isomerase QueA [Anabaena cylindrica FACHB-243]MBY5280359.1 tRNA preQ1(34) S-adenosylmethionine ribosyltransferase-isomerase QueA [Anabaena sp. CCAP 1446/1C]MBY5307594.1 tRNA preQ1(34) S-adenosylmethionine ribosyltransferase-isomerase Que
MSDLEIQDINLDRSLSGYDYELPTELIAQNPAVPRDSSRLLVVNSPNAGREMLALNHIFRDLPELLQPGDLLVMNNTKVMPARLYGRKSTGAKVEVLLLEERQHNCWLALVKPGKHFKVGTQIVFDGNKLSVNTGLTATVLETDAATGGRLLQFDLPEHISLVQVLEDFGEIPLPPYITASTAADEQYQTVYAQEQGAIAAPTAGLHFTPELLQKLSDRSINQAFVTLHVGVGTFRPVEVDDVTTHQMHEEWIEVSAATVEQIRATQAAGGRIIAVGTTVVRALEGAAQFGDLQPYVGKVNLFIYPGFQWRVVEGLITNFHLPRSSLLMLVSALIGRKRLLKIYQQAIASQYRFYSFGDAMLILPDGVMSMN